MKNWALTTLIVPTLVLVGCAGPMPYPPPYPGDNQSINPNLVHISNNGFIPKNIAVQKGETVTWVNDDPAPHTVTGNGFSSHVLRQGQTYKHQFNHRGEFHYYCKKHPYMKGNVSVQ